MLLYEIIGLIKHVVNYPYGIIKGSTCIESKTCNGSRPIILVHGFISNQSIWNDLEKGLRRLGWTDIYSFNYHVFKKDIYKIVDEFYNYVENVLKHYNYQTKINFIGHSMGGVLIRDWVTNYDNHKWTENVITLGSPHKGTMLAYVTKIIPKLKNVGKSLIPGSDYLKSLNKRKQPKNMNWYCINGKSDKAIIPKCNNKYPDKWNYKEIELDKVGHIHLAYSKEVLKICNKILFK
jgi:triacylglycerol esterase/lipase EstA (alpha/beta hydrolase family)